MDGFHPLPISAVTSFSHCKVAAHLQWPAPEHVQELWQNPELGCVIRLQILDGPSPLACPSSPRSIAATWCTACQSAPPARHQSLHIWPLIFSIGLPDLKCIPLLTQATDTWFGAAANKPQLRDPWSLEDKVAASKIFLAEPSSNTQLMQFAGKAASSKQAQLL